MNNIHSAYSMVAACSSSVPGPEYVERSFLVRHGEREAKICTLHVQASNPNLNTQIGSNLNTQNDLSS